VTNTENDEFVKVEAELTHLTRILEYRPNDNPRELSLEDLLAIFRVHNIVIGNFICENMTFTDFDSNSDIMPGYELSYQLFEEIGKNLNELRSKVRSQGRSKGRYEKSIAEELFSCLLTYIEMSSICGRKGWYDVNKRAADLMAYTLIHHNHLVERLEEIIENEGWTMQFSPTRLVVHNEIAPEWVSEFLNAVLEQYKEHEGPN